MNAAERAEREYVLGRDRECVLFKRDPSHVCRVLGGSSPHRPDNKRLLTVEHFRDKPKIGDPIVKRHKSKGHSIRAESDRFHMVAMCRAGNVAVPSQEVRDWIRDVYMKEVEG